MGILEQLALSFARCGLLQALTSHLAIFFDAIDAEVVTLQSMSNQRDGAAAGEGIENRAVGWATGLDAGFDQ